MVIITLTSEIPNMASQFGTLTLQQDQDLSPVRYNPQKDSQSKATKIIRMHLRRHDQAPMTHQRKTGKCQQNDNITRAMRLGGPNGVKDSLVLKKNQGQTNKSAIKIQNSLCVPLQTSQLCTPTDKPNLEKDIKGKASF